MDGTAATYDSESTIAENGFVRDGYLFKGCRRVAIRHSGSLRLR